MRAEIAPRSRRDHAHVSVWHSSTSLFLGAVAGTVKSGMTMVDSLALAILSAAAGLHCGSSGGTLRQKLGWCAALLSAQGVSVAVAHARLRAAAASGLRSSAAEGSCTDSDGCIALVTAALMLAGHTFGFALTHIAETYFRQNLVTAIGRRRRERAVEKLLQERVRQLEVEKDRAVHDRNLAIHSRSSRRSSLGGASSRRSSLASCGEGEEEAGSSSQGSWVQVEPLSPRRAAAQARHPDTPPLTSRSPSSTPLGRRGSRPARKSWRPIARVNLSRAGRARGPAAARRYLRSGHLRISHRRKSMHMFRLRVDRPHYVGRRDARASVRACGPEMHVLRAWVGGRMIGRRVEDRCMHTVGSWGCVRGPYSSPTNQKGGHSL